MVKYPYMRSPFDLDDFIHFASQPGATAPYVREALGLTYSDSYINRLIKRYVGKRPTLAGIQRPDALRDVVVRELEARGLDRRYCYRCGYHGTYECAIHALCREPSLDDLVFVCVKRCAGPGDF